MEELFDLQLFAEGEGGAAEGGGGTAADSNAPKNPPQKRYRAGKGSDDDTSTPGEIAPGGASRMPRPTEQKRYRAARGSNDDTGTASELAGGPAARAGKGSKDDTGTPGELAGGASRMPRPTEQERYRAARGSKDDTGTASELAGGPAARAAQGSKDDTGTASEIAPGGTPGGPAAALKEHFRRLETEAEMMREVFPGFDLRRELRDPRFAALTAPGMGVSVEDAYYALHRQELQAASMQVAAQRAAQKLASSIQSAARRPVENGAGSTSPAGLGSQSMTPKQREQLRQRIHNAAAMGTKIYP